MHAQGEKDVTEAKDAVEASKATAAAAKDSEGVLAKEAAAVKAGIEEGDTAGVDVKQEGEGAAAASERAASEQDASTSGREAVPGQSFLDLTTRSHFFVS